MTPPDVFQQKHLRFKSPYSNYRLQAPLSLLLVCMQVCPVGSALRNGELHSFFLSCCYSAEVGWLVVYGKVFATLFICGHASFISVVHWQAFGVLALS